VLPFVPNEASAVETDERAAIVADQGAAIITDQAAAALGFERAAVIPNQCAAVVAARSVIFDYHDPIASLPGSTAVRERLEKNALDYLDNLAAEGTSDPGLLRELATAYQRVRQIQGNSYYSNLGDSVGALKSYRASLAW
jgi:hypothetical protein